MMKQNFIPKGLLAILCSLAITGCVTEKADQSSPANTEPIDVTRIADCHARSNPYPSQIHANLEGSWVLNKMACTFSGATTTITNQVVLTFNDAALYKVFKDGTLIEEGSYVLTASTNGNWEISNSSSASEYLNGVAFVCGNELMLYSSFRDGCDHYYIMQ